MEELIKCCEIHNESLTSCLVVLNYYKHIGISEEEAIPHVIKLVKEGWFKEVKKLCKTRLS